jgi:hypothetical protein
MSTYAIDNANDKSSRDPVFCSELGLAIEKLKDNISIDDLWNVGA